MIIGYWNGVQMHLQECLQCSTHHQTQKLQGHDLDANHDVDDVSKIDDAGDDRTGTENQNDCLSFFLCFDSLHFPQKLPADHPDSTTRPDPETHECGASLAENAQEKLLPKDQVDWSKKNQQAQWTA